MTGEHGCFQTVMIDNATDGDWLITQYIDTTLSSGMSLNEVQVNIDLRFSDTCMGTCLLQLHIYETDVENNTGQGRTRLTDGRYRMSGNISNGINTVRSINASGFYLGIRASGGTSVTINQISIRHTICPENTINFVAYPVSYASASEVNGICLDNSQSLSGMPTEMCGDDGTWSSSSSCVCSSGYEVENDVCTGS